VYFGLTTAIAVVIGLAVVMILGPGSGIDSAGLQPPDVVRQARDASPANLVGELVPGSLLGAVASGRLLG